MDFASQLLSKISKSAEFSVGAQNSSARASSFSMAAARFGAAGVLVKEVVPLMREIREMDTAGT